MTAEEFKELNPAQKRVTIAQDVIDQLDAGKYKAKSGNYLNFKKEFIPAEEGADLQEILNKATVCEVCALGAAFASYVRINDQCPFNPEEWTMDYNDDGDVELRGRTCFTFQETMMQLFGPQLDLIEAAFEGSFSALLRLYTHEINQDDLRNARNMYPIMLDDEPRLRLIMHNIIDNKGDFVLPKK